MQIYKECVLAFATTNATQTNTQLDDNGNPNMLDLYLGKGSCYADQGRSKSKNMSKNEQKS